MAKFILLGPAFPYRGGIASNVERLAKALTEAGHEAIVYNFSLQYPGFLFPGKTQFTTGEAPKGIDIRVKVNSINPFNWLKVGNELRRMKPDVLIIRYWLPFMGPCFGTIARIAKWNKHAKVITILDNIIPHERRFGDRLFTKYFVKPVDAFLAMSHSVLEDLKQFDTKKPTAFNPHPLFDNYGLPFSKEEAKKKLGLDVNQHYILFFGFVRAYKGLDLLLKAMANEELKKKNIKLIIAGEFYEDRKVYDELIEQLHLKDNIIQYSDLIPDAEVAKYFCAADLVVQPYKHATQSGVTQIAYQFNKPMVVTNVGGLPEIVPDDKAGYVVEPEPTAIANAINRFYDSGKEDEFIENVKEEKKKFLWDKMVRTIEQLYLKVK